MRCPCNVCMLTIPAVEVYDIEKPPQTTWLFFTEWPFAKRFAVKIANTWAVATQDEVLP